MKNTQLSELSTDELVARFVAATKAMGTAVLDHETQKANQVFQTMWDIDQILRSRGRDARAKLLPLLDDKDRFVRYYTAKKLLGVAPDRARAVIEGVAEPKYDALSLDAGMCLYALDEGIFQPD